MIHRLTYRLVVCVLGFLVAPIAHGKRTENGASPGICETLYTQWNALDNEDKRLYDKETDMLKKRNHSIKNAKEKDKDSFRKVDGELDKMEDQRRHYRDARRKTAQSMAAVPCASTPVVDFPELQEPNKSDSCSGSWMSERERGTKKLPCYQ